MMVRKFAGIGKREMVLFFLVGLLLFGLNGWKVLSIYQMYGETLAPFPGGMDEMLQSYSAFFTSFLRFLLPQCLFLFFFGNMVRKNLILNSSILFTRASTVDRVVNPILCELILGVFASYLGLLIESGIWGKLRGQPLNLTGRKTAELLGTGLYFMFFILCVNLLSFFMDTLYAVVGMLLLELIALNVGYFYWNGWVPKWVYCLMPTAPCLWNWNQKIPELVLWIWVGYLGLLSVIGIKLIKNLLRRKEWIE